MDNVRNQLAMTKMNTVESSDSEYAGTDAEFAGKQVLKLHFLEKP